MTDRELLELAAKAAGIEIKWETPFVALGDFAQFPHNNLTGDQWNPITDDGDALRLAVQLGIEYRIMSMPHGDGVQAYDWKTPAVFELYNDDPYAATRRAIVRAAAAIGEQMK